MLLFEVLILEFGAVDRFTTGSSLKPISNPPTLSINGKDKPIAGREISTLEHKAFDDAVESAALVVKGLSHLSHPILSGTQRAEVFGRLRANYNSINNLFVLQSSYAGSSLSLYYT